MIDKMKIKKYFAIFFMCCILAVPAVFFSGCSERPGQPEEVVGLVNQIAPAGLTEEQRDIIDLLSATQDILLFDFKTEEEYRSIEVWVDIFEYGVLVEQGSGISMFGAQRRPLDGQIAVVINRDDSFRSFQWTFIISEDGTRVSSSVSDPVTVSHMSAHNSGPLPAPANIQDGAAIMLYVSKFSDDGIRLSGDFQRYFEQPELLAEYPRLHIVQARFSR